MAKHNRAARERVERLAKELQSKLAPFAAPLRQKAVVVWSWQVRSVVVKVLLSGGIVEESIARVEPAEGDSFESVFTRAWMRASAVLEGRLQHAGQQHARSAAYRRLEAEREEAEGRALRELARTLRAPESLAWTPDVVG